MSLSYHYTTIGKFQKMLDNSVGTDGKVSEFLFWASSIYAMNDPQEFLFGYDILWNDVIPELEGEIGIKEDKYKLSKLWKQNKNSNRDEWKKKMINTLYDNHQIPFIISFSRKSDFLPMWMTYAGNGNGICLAFNNYDYKIGNNFSVDIIYNLHASEVTYGVPDDSVKKIILQQYRNLYTRYSKIKNDEHRANIMTQTSAFLSIIAAPYHKHHAYEYEQEERLIVFKKDEKEVKYRCNENGRLIPYIVVKVNAKFLERIIIGPCADYESVKRELFSQFKRYGINIDNDSIIPSEVPYRVC